MNITLNPQINIMPEPSQPSSAEQNSSNIEYREGSALGNS